MRARDDSPARGVELGLPAGDDDPLLVDLGTGGVEALSAHLARARLTLVSLEANAGVCRGMLHDRCRTIGIGEKEEQMRAVRLHEYHQDPVVEEVPEPTIAGPDRRTPTGRT